MRYHRPLLLELSFVLIALLALAGPGKTQGPEDLIPRVPAPKETAAPLPPETVLSHVTIKFHEGAHVRLRKGTLRPLGRNAAERGRLAALGLSEPEVEADVAFAQRIAAKEPRVKGLGRLFRIDEQTLSQWKESGEGRSRRQLADLDLYYRLSVTPGTTAGDVAPLLAELNALPSVEIAYAVPPPQPASLGDLRQIVAASSTPGLQHLQGYLKPAPRGIDAEHAWSFAGGRGEGVKVIDIEGAWRMTHEDMPDLIYAGGSPPNDPDRRNHGTAVVGVIAARDNGYGITGISNQVRIGVESTYGQDTASAVLNAALAAGRGGVVLIEVHSPGPVTSSPCTCNLAECDFIPEEYWPEAFDAIAYATNNGIIVVEAAGNGSSSLDDPVYENRFNRSTRDSGAILVAASASEDRTPTCWTNWGSRIDVHGWGEDVVTLGYGDLWNAGGEDFFYTATFGGTSSASPIVTGAAAILQGISQLTPRIRLSPAAVRHLLVATGTPQVPGAKKIGPLPDLKKAIQKLHTDQAPAASFTFSCSALSCTFASTSTDDDGITDSSWFFSNGSATGPTVSHTFTASGHYRVTLSVTDTLGAETSITRTVPVSSLPVDFALQYGTQAIGGAPGTVTGAQMIPADWNGDGYQDLLVFKPADGSFRKWYGGPGTTPGFTEQPVRHLGGAPGAVTDAQMIPTDFDGDGHTDILVFRASSGAYWKWYSAAADPSPDFRYQVGRYIDGASGAVTGAQMIPVDFSGDGRSDLVVFRSSDGSFRKWYGDIGAPGPDFSTPQPVRYIGGAPGALPGTSMSSADFDGNGKSDILLFKASNGSFWKWHGDPGGPYPDFGYNPGQFLQDTPGAVVEAQMLRADFNADGKSDVLAFRPADGAYWKLYSDGTGTGSTFTFAYAPRYLGGSPGALAGAQMIPMDFNGDGKSDVLVFRPSDGTYWKWYGN